FELFMEMVHPEDRDEIEEAYDKSLKNNEPYHEVYRVQINDGTTKYVEARAVHFYD
ncbi:MAG: PAS domain-containing protein, partial [Nitrosopumilaceae archaeon]|nr:PAS domain-containing protein [Nitrosopumilaceae archaeon]NIU88494.1 PAS domain-containing protein [Nitrosopumilaceae archaeon]NIV66856.1 PAS domain-containing protein [Nitrosopumilaceae archaeon]NIX62698.1 PAS domain-containing protein [Nitrosopumilaceae archaeon]